MGHKHKRILYCISLRPTSFLSLTITLSHSLPFASGWATHTGDSPGRHSQPHSNHTRYHTSCSFLLPPRPPIFGIVTSRHMCPRSSHVSSRNCTLRQSRCVVKLDTTAHSAEHSSTTAVRQSRPRVKFTRKPIPIGHGLAELIYKSSRRIGHGASTPTLPLLHGVPALHPPSPTPSHLMCSSLIKFPSQSIQGSVSVINSQIACALDASWPTASQVDGSPT